MNESTANSKFSMKKMVAVVATIILCWVASLLVLQLTTERENRQTEAEQDISTKWGESQEVVGPILVIPAKERLASGDIVDRQVYILPEELSIKGDIAPEVRTRGIFDVAVYQGTLDFDGVFDTSNITELPNDFVSVDYTKSYVSLGLSDTRGIESQLNIQWNDQEVAFKPGSNMSGSVINPVSYDTSSKLFAPQGIHAPVAVRAGGTSDFSLSVDIKGSKSLRVAPVGRDTRVEMSSDWNSPSFVGNYLPESRDVQESGFTASWLVSSFGKSYGQALLSSDQVALTQVKDSLFGVELINQLDIYSMTERTVKYAILFILLTFSIFFVYEVLQSLKVHPVQYLLIGASLALFYLLLLSLSEHIGFGMAYLISSIGIIGMISFYSSTLLKDKKKVSIVTAILTVLYVFIYFVLQLEDYALLAGSILIFIALGSIMYLTRKVNWYKIQ